MVEKNGTGMGKDFGPSDHKVELISCTPHALELLLYTKNTRLQGAESIQDIIAWPMEKKLEHLAYMRGTIKSSWEFVDYVFKISGVTRAFTHQLVRTRTGSYAQEAMRVTKAAGGVAIPASLSTEREQVHDGYVDSDHDMFVQMASDAMENYETLLQAGVAPQDARGLLPTNVKTSIIAKFNLRTLHETAKLRLCTRTQGEYQNVFRDMRDLVFLNHPWAKDFINVYCAEHLQCAFPHYLDCPIKQGFAPTLVDTPNKRNLRLQIIDEMERTRYESAPDIAKGAKSK